MAWRQQKCWLVLLACCFHTHLFAQTCPPNIDFEKGTLDGWRFFSGSVLDQGGINVFDLTESPTPEPGRHTIIPAATAGLDPFGNFPMRSPNGSDYCVMLGNNTG
ncbi:MAG: hypothetical protein IT252_06355, partial [Chitinophagaceae bacterium]|nr:hypothetical protein [Chitinophagaceae bacterium]